eukprot:2480606-Prymnesium_polylepis.1
MEAMVAAAQREAARPSESRAGKRERGQRERWVHAIRQSGNKQSDQQAIRQASNHAITQFYNQADIRQSSNQTNT